MLDLYLDGLLVLRLVMKLLILKRKKHHQPIQLKKKLKIMKKILKKVFLEKLETFLVDYLVDLDLVCTYLKKDPIEDSVEVR